MLAALGAFPLLTANAQQRWGRDYFPNIALQDQNGRTLRFYDDVIRNKVVAINFIYTNCTTLCPVDTAKMREVHELLGDKMGRDVFFYSISIDPRRDTPATLRRYMQAYDVGPGWTFLVGDLQQVTMLQRKLGITPPDPNNLNSHDARILMGNERMGKWIKRSTFENPQNIAHILRNVVSEPSTRTAQDAGSRVSYASASPITDTSQGIYLFRTRCASCHTIGGGDRLGPDLKGVVAARPRAWLTRWIREPDKMLAEGDPTAIAMKARYRNLPMPNLGLSEAEAHALIEYIAGQSAPRPVRSSAPSASPTRSK